MKNGPQPSPQVSRRYAARVSPLLTSTAESTDGDMTAGRRRSTSSEVGVGSRIPVPSSSLFSPSTPRRRPHHHRSLQSVRLGVEDDTDSVRSYGSSGGSSTCEHAHFGRNGTTYSGRSRRYVVHCSTSHDSPHDYLTPTQRANATIRQLKSMLNDSRVELDEKDKEIARLTKEIVELRFVKAESAGDDEDIAPPMVNGHASTPLASSQCTEVSTPDSSKPHGRGSPLAVSTSLSDSGHFEELSPHASPRICNPNLERDIEKIKHQHEEEVKVLKETNNAKVDNLVQRLAEANDRYCDLRPQLEAMQSKIEVLEREKAELLAKNIDNEEKHKNMYLQMFHKGQQAALFEETDGKTVDGQPILSVPDLIKQLEVTKQELESVRMMYRRLLENKKSKAEQDAEVTLQFLKSAIYYFLTDRENMSGHLAAIQSILGFTQEERLAIERASYAWK